MNTSVGDASACRICYEPNNLHQLCKCDGTMKYVHKECIEKWIKVSNRKQCELCGEPWSLIEENDTLNGKVHYSCQILRILAITYATLAMIISLYALLVNYAY